MYKHQIEAIRSFAVFVSATVSLVGSMMAWASTTPGVNNVTGTQLTNVSSK
jgi:hypothetical protein